MRNRNLLQALVLSVALLLVTPAAQARVGGGRSFGSRGSRSTAPRYTPPARSFGGNNNNQANPSPYAARPVQPQSPLAPRFGSGGGFWHGLAGGLAGGLIGSWLFGRHGGYGYDGGAASGYGGGGMFGFLEILIMFGVAFLIFRWFRGQRYAGPVGGLYSVNGGGEPTPIYTSNDEPNTVVDDPDSLIGRHESGYQREAFLEARTDDFFRIQAAFMSRDLTSARLLLTPETEAELEKDAAALRASGRTNRLENITVRQTDLAEAWEESGHLYATVHFKANLLDYVVDDAGQVVSGSRTEPVKFEEYWTFTRDIGFAAQSTGWKLTAIQQA